ncbi:MAG: ThuA domain-containing protein [Saprospiraceae bacterium]|nr:ThuA domain-containing protein [Saprospiraceae bacterium]
MKNYLLYSVVGLFAILACGETSNSAKRLLVFSKTSGFRHTSIAPGKEAILKMATEHGYEVDTTEDAMVFNQNSLKKYQAIIFFNTTGDCLNDQQQLEMMRYIQAGGGFVGIHAAADTEYKWPWYGRLVGAYFNGHPNNPNVREADVVRLDSSHISCAHLPLKWHRNDEWYNYRDIQPDLNLLLNLDETSYEGGTNGSHHPIAWYHDFDGGRAFYTGGGHTDESFSEAAFLLHLWGGVEYAVGQGKIDYDRPSVAPQENRFQKIVLTDNLYEPMEMAMLPDRRILFIERRGDIHLFDPSIDSLRLIHTLEVNFKLEDGLLGLALDPNFSENHWLYLLYSPPGEQPKQHVSRFTLTNNQLDLASEAVLLEIPTQRDECCHSGGCLEFGPDGHLYMSTGDNTNPFASDGFSPSDERPGRSAWDAQKSSSNANDLRGKILRIHPEADGSYTIPDGNLFPKDGSQGKPEIYVMGCRNPFRMSIDQRSGFLYWGEVGPDAGKDSLGRGPKGHDEVNQARKAGFFGWPYFVGNNKPYNEYNFASKQSLAKYDAALPINNSPNNTGISELPPANAAFIWYPYDESAEFPLVGTGGRNAMAGPIFYLNDYPDTDARFPAYYDGKLFTYDWIRGWIMSVKMNENGDFVTMERFLPSQKFSNPIDIIMSPEGEMYILEYGTAWNAQNPDARLVHLKYIKGNRQPVAKALASEVAGANPFEVQFSSEGTLDPDDDQLNYHWSFGDGEGTSNEKNPTYIYIKPGSFTATLTVTDQDQLISTDAIKIMAGNEPPQLSWNIQGNQTFYWPGATVEYNLNVIDKEDGSVGNGIDPESVTLSIKYLEQGVDINEIALGHEALANASRFVEGRNLMDQSDCKACHFVDRESVGPMFELVAQKYHSDKNAQKYLTDKIINGGGGVWGVNAMAAHPQHTLEEANKMVDYILSLADRQNTGDLLPLSGTYQFATTNDKDAGSYILMASYTDKGTNGLETLTSREILRLRNPKVSASDYDTAMVAQKFTLTAEQASGMGATGPMVILIAADGGFIGFSNLDLTGVVSIDMLATQNESFTGGGTITLHIDKPGGSEIGSASMDEPTKSDSKILSVPLNQVEGIHDLYLTFKGLSDKAVAVLINIEFIRAESL